MCGPPLYEPLWEYEPPVAFTKYCTPGGGAMSCRRASPVVLSMSVGQDMSRARLVLATMLLWKRCPGDVVQRLQVLRTFPDQDFCRRPIDHVQSEPAYLLLLTSSVRKIYNCVNRAKPDDEQSSG